MEELREKVEKQYAAFPPKLRRKIKFSPTLNMYNDIDGNMSGRFVRIAFEFPESPAGKLSLKDLIKILQKDDINASRLEKELLKELSDNMTRIKSEETAKLQEAVGKKATRLAVDDIYEANTGQSAQPGTGPADLIRGFVGVQPPKTAKGRKTRRRGGRNQRPPRRVIPQEGRCYEGRTFDDPENFTYLGMYSADQDRLVGLERQPGGAQWWRSWFTINGQDERKLYIFDSLNEVICDDDADMEAYNGARRRGRKSRRKTLRQRK